jgi:hypothetical protein
VPPKAKTPAPIDRPLSRAYLREFSGWSTAYPPGLSDPTSLRVMENVQINRDGSCRIRPGLRYLSYGGDDVGIDQACVGSHEPFFLNDGTKAYLFAVREDDDTVGFRVLVLTGLGATVRHLTDVGVDFVIPDGEASLNFTSATTYVKYLQIDNKIFALSNAGETLRLFTVGQSKTAKRLSSIERPNWNVLDKLTVVEPDAAWITSGVPTSVRTNKVKNPSFDINGMPYWTPDAATLLGRMNTGVAPVAGTYKGTLQSLPTRTNLMPQPLHDMPTYGTAGWLPGSGTAAVTVDGTSLKAAAPDGASNGNFYLNGPEVAVAELKENKDYNLAFDFTGYQGISDFGLLYRFYNSAGVQIGGDVYATTVNPATINGTRVVTTFLTPAGTAKMRVFPYAKISAGAQHYFKIKAVVIAALGEPTSIFFGDMGANYFWTGLANQSSSVYHPPLNVRATSAKYTATAGLDYTGSVYFRGAATARECWVELRFYNAGGGLTGSVLSSVGGEMNDTASWVRIDVTGTAPASTTHVEIVPIVKLVPRNELQFIDAVLLEEGAVLGSYFDGDFVSTPTNHYAWNGSPKASESTLTIYAIGTTIPAAETPTANTLISSVDADNDYNFGFFYTISN